MVEGQDNRSPEVGRRYKRRENVTIPYGLPERIKLTRVNDRVVEFGSIMMGVAAFFTVYEEDHDES